jgi:hypothetical protein
MNRFELIDIFQDTVTHATDTYPYNEQPVNFSLSDKYQLPMLKGKNRNKIKIEVT